MNAEQFWSIVEGTREAAKRDWRPRRSVLDLHEHHLALAMRGLTPLKMIVFACWWGRLMGHLHRHDLRAAVYWACSCASDDHFLDVRKGLVALGRDSFVRVLENADNLVDVLERWDVDSMAAEDITGIPTKVYEQVTGSADVPDSIFDQAQTIVDAQPDGLPPLPERPDNEFDFTDPAVMRERFPRLTKKLPTTGEFT